MTQRTVFLREATGLVREMSTWDVFYYNFLTIAIFAFGPRLAFTASGGTFPGSSPALGYLFTTVGCLPIVLAYLMLAVSMPRAGAEYVYQSRALHPAIGFSTTFTVWVIWLGNFAAWGAITLVQSGIFPLTVIVGPSASSFGSWVLTPMGTFAVSVVVAVIVFIFCVPGLRAYVRLQRLLFWGTIAAALVLIVALAVTPAQSFAQEFNKFMLNYQNNPDFYDYVVSSANSSGFNTNPAFNLIGTFGIMPTAYTGLVWGWWSAMQQGEVKRGSEVKHQMIGMVGSTIVAGIILAVIAYLFVNTLGYSFWNGLGYAVTSSTKVAATFPTLPDYMLLGAIVGSTISPILAIIILVGAIFNLTQIVFNSSIPFPRLTMQYAMDRLLPAKIADVSERWHSPVLGYVVNFIITLGWIALICFTAFGATLLSAFAISSIVIAASMLSAILLPYRAKPIWDVSPVKKYKLAGVPVIVVIGILGFLYNAWMMYYYFAYPAIYGAASPPMLAFGVGDIIALIIFYFVVKSYRKRQGIDINQAFTQLPPE